MLLRYLICLALIGTTHLSLTAAHIAHYSGHLMLADIFYLRTGQKIETGLEVAH
jgi:hypothetical protein